MLNNREIEEKHTAAKESMPTGGFSRKRHTNQKQKYAKRAKKQKKAYNRA
jgi:hypothetical protein